MVNAWITSLLLLASLATRAQEISVSLGVFTGITSSFTIDRGINQDPRYTASYGVKFAPVGLNLGIDYEAFGLGASPGLLNLGQTFYVVNTSGGHDGRRTIDLQYLSIPVAFKVHIINLSFFKISALASIGPAYLLKGSEVVSHTDTKLRFPTEVYPILPSDYVVQYDGVVSPELIDYTISAKEDFNTFQIFVGAGFRSDWDVSEHWRVSVDFRMNYGLYDPRNDQYLTRVNNHQTLYDVPGKRNDLFAQLSLGISRFIIFEKKDQEQKKKLKGSSKKYKPVRYPYAKPRNKKPNG